ncbi:hypothetical protein A3739_00410 [Oleiphilus sp. HI0067]|nr:hypothetical protein A3739_00410 [Oleiphilus sp. HI0067]
MQLLLDFVQYRGLGCLEEYDAHTSEKPEITQRKCIFDIEIRPRPILDAFKRLGLINIVMLQGKSFKLRAF